jgi:hypothetical protein
MKGIQVSDRGPSAVLTIPNLISFLRILRSPCSSS